MHYLAEYVHTHGGLILSGRPDRGRGRLLRGREELLRRRRLGMDEAEHMVHRRGDVVRRRQAAPLLHLHPAHRHTRLVKLMKRAPHVQRTMAGQGIGEPAARQKTRA